MTNTDKPTERDDKKVVDFEVHKKRKKQKLLSATVDRLVAHAKKLKWEGENDD